MTATDAGAVTAPESRAATTATVGLLSSDIEGSTRLLQQLGPVYSEVLLEHRDLLRAAFGAHHGEEQSTEGDAFFLTFPTASDAVAAALAAQRALAAHSWSADADVRVRMGVHVGEIQTVAGTIMGMAVHETARIGAAAHGGQVLVSAIAVELAGPLSDEASWLDLGNHRLKDIGTPVQLFQLTHADLTADFEPIRSQGASRNNLPAQASAFIGREREVAEVDALLVESRLVTVTGAGGAGKSRIALRVAADQGDRFGDGVWFVDLAPVSDSAAVLERITGAMGLPDAAADDLVVAIGQRQVLLLADNCEHVLTAVVEVVDELLRGCPGVSVLATSREPLGVQGEVAWRLPSLDETDAIELFRTRARAVNSRFTVTDVNREAVAEVCRRLDAMPLTLELAAARLGSLSVEQLATRLDQRFRLLAGGARGAMARQRTLQATVDWSYDLLDPAERSTLRRLGVFVSGFTLEAAEAVCVTESVEAVDVFDLVDRLVAKSLVLAEERDGAVRYRLLETIRHYALDRLIQEGEMDPARDAHMRWVQQLALTAEPPIWFGGEADEWLSRLDDEAANLRAGFDWALDGGQADIATSMLIATLWWFLARGRWREGLDWCARLLPAAATPEDRSLRAFAEFQLASQGAGSDAESLARIRREIEWLPNSSHPWLAPAADAYMAAASITAGEAESAILAVEACEAAVDAARSFNDTALAMSLQALAMTHARNGSLDAARAAGEEALGLMGAAGLSVGQTRISSSLARIALLAGDLDGAWVHAVRAVEIGRGTGDTPIVLHGSLLLANVAARRGELPSARDLLLSVLDAVADVGTDQELADIHNDLAWYMLLDGEREAADLHATRAIELLSSPSPLEAVALHTAAEAARANGDLRRAWDLLLRAARICRLESAAHSELIPSVVEGFAGVRMELGDAEGAARLLAAAAAHRPEDESRIDAETRMVRKVSDAARAALGAARFKTLSNEGTMLDLDSALAAAEKMALEAPTRL